MFLFCCVQWMFETLCYSCFRNLQAAICSYFEFQSTHKLPNMTLVQDVTIGEGESVPPQTRYVFFVHRSVSETIFCNCLWLCVLFSFVKTWKVANNGDDRWPDGSYLAFTGGVNLALQTAVPVAPLNPGEVTDINVDMNSPSLPGMYESKWRMVTPNGSYFGG